jgi:amino acid permease
MEISNEKVFGVGYGVIYVINTCIGAGFLVMPWAYKFGGIIF